MSTQSYQWLQRQYASSLYERLALSRNKDEVMRLAEQGQIVDKPVDIIKSPITLEFLGLKTDTSYSESRLESAIINKLQIFRAVWQAAEQAIKYLQFQRAPILWSR